MVFRDYFGKREAKGGTLREINRPEYKETSAVKKKTTNSAHPAAAGGNHQAPLQHPPTSTVPAQRTNSRRQTVGTHCTLLHHLQHRTTL
jgi:hypothetical protein